MKVTLNLPKTLVTDVQDRASHRGESFTAFAKAALEDALVLTDPELGEDLDLDVDATMEELEAELDAELAADDADEEAADEELLDELDDEPVDEDLDDELADDEPADHELADEDLADEDLAEADLDEDLAEDDLDEDLSDDDGLDLDGDDAEAFAVEAYAEELADVGAEIADRVGALDDDADDLLEDVDADELLDEDDLVDEGEPSAADELAGLDDDPAAEAATDVAVEAYAEELADVAAGIAASAGVTVDGREPAEAEAVAFVSDRDAIPMLATDVAAFVGRARQGPVDEAVEVDSLAAFEEVFGPLWRGSRLGHSVKAYFDNGGEVAVVVRARASDGGALKPADLVGPDAAAEGRGLHALDVVDVNLLVIPPYTREGSVDAEVLRAAAAWCAERRAVLLVDTPPRWRSVADVRDAALAEEFADTRANVVVHHPMVVAPDPTRDGKPTSFAPSGAIAGLISRTDREKAVWRAAAGADAVLAGVDRLRSPLANNDGELLGRLGVNVLRELPDGRGVALWGARMLDAADERSPWRYVPVRRTALMIEASVAYGLAWVADEPSDETTWAEVAGLTEEFMSALFAEGAFRGDRPADAFFVRCDASTMTQADVDAGLVVLELGFAPLKPSEFVRLRLVLQGQPAS